MKCANGAGHLADRGDMGAVSDALDQHPRMDVSRNEQLSRQQQRGRYGRHSSPAFAGIGDGF